MCYHFVGKIVSTGKDLVGLVILSEALIKKNLSQHFLVLVALIKSFGLTSAHDIASSNISGLDAILREKVGKYQTNKITTSVFQMICLGKPYIDRK